MDATPGTAKELAALLDELGSASIDNANVGRVRRRTRKAREAAVDALEVCKRAIDAQLIRARILLLAPPDLGLGDGSFAEVSRLEARASLIAQTLAALRRFEAGESGTEVSESLLESGDGWEVLATQIRDETPRTPATAAAARQEAESAANTSAAEYGPTTSDLIASARLTNDTFGRIVQAAGFVNPPFGSKAHNQRWSDDDLAKLRMAVEQGTLSPVTGKKAVKFSQSTKELCRGAPAWKFPDASKPQVSRTDRK